MFVDSKFLEVISRDVFKMETHRFILKITLLVIIINVREKSRQVETGVLPKMQLNDADQTSIGHSSHKVKTAIDFRIFALLKRFQLQSHNL